MLLYYNDIAIGHGERSADVARALNSLLDFFSEDQQSLVEVIQDYFTFPDGSTGSDIEDELSEDDDDIEPASDQVLIHIEQQQKKYKYNRNREAIHTNKIDKFTTYKQIQARGMAAYRPMHKWEKMG